MTWWWDYWLYEYWSLCYKSLWLSTFTIPSCIALFNSLSSSSCSLITSYSTMLALFSKILSLSSNCLFKLLYIWWKFSDDKSSSSYWCRTCRFIWDSLSSMKSGTYISFSKRDGSESFVTWYNLFNMSSISKFYWLVNGSISVFSSFNL